MKRKPLKNNQDNMEEDKRHLPFQPPQYNFPINQSINQSINIKTSTSLSQVFKNLFKDGHKLK